MSKTFGVEFGSNTIELLGRLAKADLGSCISEPLDNSLDQHAKNIWLRLITAGEGIMEIRDDGPGSLYDAPTIMKIGGLMPNRPKDSIGLWSAGLKIAAYLLAPRMEVINRNQYLNYRIFVNWEKVRRGEDPFTVEMIPSNGTTGFTVRLIDPYTSFFEQWSQLPELLSYRYSKALEDGCTITIDDNPIEPFVIPPLEDVINYRDLMMQGLRLSIYAGILPESADDIGGWTVRRHFRNIYERFRKFGFGGRGSGRIFCLVDLLGEGWPLNVLKDGIPDEQPFFESLYPYIQPLMEKLQYKDFSLPLELNELPLDTEEEPARIKPKEPTGKTRAPRTKTDSASPSGREKKEPELEPSGLGKHKKPRRKHALRVRYELAPGQGLGYVSIEGKNVTVSINEAHDVVKWTRTRKKAAYILAIDVLVHDYRNRPDNMAYAPIRAIDNGLRLGHSELDLKAALFERLNFKILSTETLEI